MLALQRVGRSKFGLNRYRGRRSASAVVQVVSGAPSRMVHCTFSILDIDADGLLDVERFTSQQFARVDDPFAPARQIGRAHV